MVELINKINIQKLEFIMPDISNMSVEQLKRLQLEAEALIASKKIKQSKMHIIKF